MEYIIEVWLFDNICYQLLAFQFFSTFFKS